MMQQKKTNMAKRKVKEILSLIKECELKKIVSNVKKVPFT